MLAERAYYGLCLAVGRAIRSGRYASVRVVSVGGEWQVRKRRHALAPLIVGLGGRMLGVLGVGVRILPQRGWEAQERHQYVALYGRSVDVAADGTLVLPFLPGRTLAALLDDVDVHASTRRRAIAWAVAALAAVHREGLTHGDAMAENVMVDIEAGTARWFDFETAHDPARSPAWRRADDLRALLATCLLRTDSDQCAETMRVVVDGYGDEAVTRLLALAFASAWRRPLAFHLGQAALSFDRHRAIGRLLRAHSGP